MKEKITGYKARRYIIVGLVVIAVALAGYYMGYGKGVLDTWRLIAENVEELIDIKLTPRAKMVLEGNPQILRLIITPESLEKYFQAVNYSWNIKGGLGPDIFR